MELSEDVVDDILYASRTGDVDDLRRVIEAETLQQGRQDVDEVLNKVQRANESHNSPLHYASANGHENIIAYLVPLCNLHSLLAQNESGNTPLHWAAFNGHLSVVKTLVDRIESLVSEKGEKGSGQKDDEGVKKTEEEREAELEKEAQRRSVWDLVNKAGRGPMSEAQMNNKELVVDFLLARMVTAPAAAAATAQNGDGGEEKSVSTGTEVSQGTEAAEGRPNAELSYEVERLKVDDETLQQQ